MEVLADAGTAMRPCEIHAAVEARLGRPIPRATVKSFLLHASKGEAATLERVGGARYQLGRHGARQPSRASRLDTL